MAKKKKLSRYSVKLATKRIFEPDADVSAPTALVGSDRLTFDGYRLTWHGASSESWTAFSGRADESADEAVKDEGPTPQGMYTIDPKNIQLVSTLPPPHNDAAAWGKRRVRIEPQKTTLDRMNSCLKVLRCGMYVHGGEKLGTLGCIEINDDREEDAFFDKLRKYGKLIDLEVKYSGPREKKYEHAGCPY